MPCAHFEQEFWSCLALSHTPGLGAKAAKRLLDHYGTASSAVKDARNWPYFNLVSSRLTENFLQGHWQQPARDEWDKATKLGLSILLITDKRYPYRLAQIPDAPLHLYCRGDYSLLKRPGLAIVGSRNCSEYGLNYAAEIARDLSKKGVTIISGFAYGIDRQAHSFSLPEIGRSIAVLGTGIDLIYPNYNKDLWKRMAKSGLILSEFSPGTPAEPYNFPRRNRIISGLSLGVLVVEASIKSGSLITARLALEQNREVFAIPGPLHRPTYKGCHELLRQGALLIRSAQDIIEELYPVLEQEFAECFQQPQTEANIDNYVSLQDSKKVSGEGLNYEEKMLTEIIQQQSKVHIDTLSQRLGWESKKTSQILLLLEMRGVVKKLPGMHYAMA